ncbi:hypothetical protein [Hymenobacter coccineus]|uniref:3D domain-containing protein n=1 Tax=Hymenobacter coccineus TaxID=1908235 RepID=A0A1G1TGX4_9BACT|nr:hypothetical protein [Hymenobacter coccineus]OGX90063.1 hypothetical protein BEN49_23980 [Hymenobacter coccineus]
MTATGLSAPFFRAGTARRSPTTTTVSASRTAARRAPRHRPAAFQALAAHGPSYTVTATAYSAVPGQTDDEPFVTADNSTIPANYTSNIRWLALSHDLLKRWDGPFAYGDTVRVAGISPALDGVYTIHDTMNRRHRHCLDVLARPREHYDVFQPGVKIRQVSLAPHRSPGRASHLMAAR